MVWIKRFPLALLVCSNLITFSIKCELPVGDQIICLKQAFSLYQSYISCNGGGCPPHQNFTAECNSVCSSTTSASDTVCARTACPIVLLFVVDNKKHLVNTTGKYRLNITCKISTGSCNSYTVDSNSSPAQYTTQETTQKSITSLVSKFVNETSRITQKTTITIESESTPVVGNTTLIQEFPKNETHTQRYGVYDCTSTTGMIVGSAFIGLFVGVLLTGSISIFLLKRRTRSLKIPAVTHPLHNLNGRGANLQANAGETYNEIENESGSHSPKISYVLPITKDKIKSNVTTSNPEIYHHLREDYDVKDRSNYYDHAVPLNGPQEIEPDQYVKAFCLLLHFLINESHGCTPVLNYPNCCVAITTLGNNSNGNTEQDKLLLSNICEGIKKLSRNTENKKRTKDTCRNVEIKNKNCNESQPTITSDRSKANSGTDESKKEKNRVTFSVVIVGAVLGGAVFGSVITMIVFLCSRRVLPFPKISNSDCKHRSDEHLQESLPPVDETVYNEINDQAVIRIQPIRRPESAHVFPRAETYSHLHELDKEDMNESYDHARPVRFACVGEDGYRVLTRVGNNNREVQTTATDDVPSKIQNDNYFIIEPQ